MSAIGTLLATAAVTLGAVATARAVKRRLERHGFTFRPTRHGEAPVIDLKAEDGTGVWRLDPHRDR